MMKDSRRSFLKTLGGVAAVLGSRPIWVLATPRSRLSPEEVKARIRGPILTLPTPFTSDFKLDHHGVRNMVRLGLENKVEVYELTYGNSQYGVLSYDEIKKLTRVFVEAVDRRGMVIAATGPWWTGQAVDYARYAEAIGADAIQVLLPPGGSDEGYVEHFRKIAAATKLAIVLHGAPPPEQIQKFIQVPSIVGMKEDGPNEDYYADIMKKFGKRLAIFCGGEKRRYLWGQPYGSPAWFSFFITFAPQVAVSFYEAVKRKDLDAERAIIEKYEKPVYALCLGGPRGFHAYWRAFLEHFGVAKRYVRPPEDSCTPEDIRRISELCERLDLRPAKG